MKVAPDAVVAGGETFKDFLDNFAFAALVILERRQAFGGERAEEMHIRRVEFFRQVKLIHERVNDLLEVAHVQSYAFRREVCVFKRDHA